MTQRNKSAHNRLHQSWHRVPAQSLCFLSSISILSNGLVFAQTETSIDNIVPTVENSQPTAGTTYSIKKDIVVPTASSSQTQFSERRTKLRQRLRRQQVSQINEPVRQSTPKNETTEAVINVRRLKPQAETPQVIPARVRQENSNSTASETTGKNEVAQPSSRETTGKNKDYNNAFIDPNKYDGDTTATYQAPNSVILTERSSGCRTILSSGQVGSGSACATPNQRLATPNWLRKSQNSQLASTTNVRQTVLGKNVSWRGNQVDSGNVTRTAYRPNRFIPNPSEFATTRVSATPIAPSGGTLPLPMAEGNIAPRPSKENYDFALASVLPQIPYTGAIAYANGTGMAYPLSIPSPITSLFGWRIHPITGERRFHAGTDLGAPTGTPVLAAAKGQVESANWMGGYGLAVVIQHTSAQQTLYGHMSEIFVQPGQWVEPGTVIGRVGSTGASTGPHLHFEVRHLSQDGWVAVDPGVQLQTALSQVIQNSRTAQVVREPGS